MNAAQIGASVLALCTGVGIFLFACTIMSNGLEAASGSRVKRLFGRTEKNKLVGVGVGAATTAVIQSSSAASVMVIGFVNAGMMTLAQAATVIFGANIGTTVTAQLVAFGMFGGGEIKSATVLSVLVLAGSITIAFAKSDKVRNIGGILAGAGLLFVGLETMSGAMNGFSELNEIKALLAAFENPLLLVFVGALITAIVQSSSVMTSMTLTMTVADLITLNQGVYLTIGANIGTCITAVLAAVAGTKNAKRVALIHLFFNIGGGAVFLAIGAVIGICGVDYERLLNTALPLAPQLQLAVFHTVFNVVSVAIALPLTNKIVCSVTKLVPDDHLAQNIKRASK